MKTYVTRFQWEGAKYPLKQSLKVLSEILGKVSFKPFISGKQHNVQLGDVYDPLMLLFAANHPDRQ